MTGAPEAELLPEIEKRLGIKLTLIEEGRARIIVPDLKAYADAHGHVDPARAPVFYNPRMAANRDIAVLAAIAYSELTGRTELKVCEPLCSTGVRGIRYALEVPEVARVVMGDVNELAVELAKANIALNKVQDKVEVRHQEANALLALHARRGTRFNIVDIDPFGCPMPFVLNAVRALGNRGMLAVTATDLPPLFGEHPRACRRKYASIPLRAPFARELGLRILVGAVVRQAAMLEVGAKVLMAYYMGHYVRAYFMIRVSSAAADEALDRIGYAGYCSRCGARWLERGFIPETRCPKCGKPAAVAGPLWAGDLWDRGFLEALSRAAGRAKLADPRRVSRLLEKLRQEIGMPPLYYRTDEAAFRKKWGREPAVADVIAKLREMGFAASPTHVDSKGIRTDAPPEAFLEAGEAALREAGGPH